MILSSLLHIVKLFQVLLYNSHNLTLVICLHTVCSIWPIDRTLSATIIPSQSGPESNGILQISQIGAFGWFSVIFRTLIRGEVSYFSAEMQSVYSTALAD